MAYRDYILCKTCGCKIVYDGDDNGRNMLETYWGKPFAPDWTVGLLCPDCIAQMEAERDALRAENDALKKQPARVSLLRKPVKHISELGPCHCPPDVCSAPVIMGVQTPCLRHAALKEVDHG